jgi:hypothetical protein
VKTVGVDLWAGQRRGVPNHATCIRPATRISLRTMRELFVEAYPRFSPACRAEEEPGLAIVAVDELSGRAAGLVRLRARVGRHVAAIVGRHDACDLFLRDIPELALRQLAVVLDPVTSWRRGSSSVRYRVLDLRTDLGFADEHHRMMRGLRAEGPAFLRCAGYGLFVLPLGDATDWPERADDAWAMLPERVYFDEQAACAEGSTQRPLIASRHHSFIMRTTGPRDTGMKLVEGGDAAGTLEVIGRHHRGTITVGSDALREGVLLGRYARCDAAGIIDDPSLSRVHVLLLQTDDALLAIDTASRNGTSIAGEPHARVIQVEDRELALGRSTRARWTWFA